MNERHAVSAARWASLSRNRRLAGRAVQACANEFAGSDREGPRGPARRPMWYESWLSISLYSKRVPAESVVRNLLGNKGLFLTYENSARYAEREPLSHWTS